MYFRKNKTIPIYKHKLTSSTSARVAFKPTKLGCSSVHTLSTSKSKRIHTMCVWSIQRLLLFKLKVHFIVRTELTSQTREFLQCLNLTRNVEGFFSLTILYLFFTWFKGGFGSFLFASECAGVQKPQNPVFTGSNPTWGLTIFLVPYF